MKLPSQLSLKGAESTLSQIPHVRWTLLSYQLLGLGGVDINGQMSVTSLVTRKALFLAIPSVDRKLSETGY